MKVARTPFRKPARLEPPPDQKLCAGLDKNLLYIRQKLTEIDELRVRHVRTAAGREAAVVFLKAQQDTRQLNQDVISPIVHVIGSTGEVPETFIADTKVTDETEVVLDALLDGRSVLLVDGWPHALVFATDRAPSRSVASATNERVVLGPHDAFTESLESNLSMIRSRLRTAELKSIKIRVGKLSPTNVMILYLEGAADASAVEQVEQSIGDLDVSVLNHVSDISPAIEGDKWSPFPQVLYTERPDVAAANILEGRVAVLSQGSPQLLLAPITFGQLFQSAEDYYLRPIIATFIRWLRVIAFILTTTAVPAYVALVSFHYDMIPLSLLSPIAQSRGPVPFTPLVEALVLDIGVELLREAGVRLPQPLGQALTVAAALVIGQSVLAAQIVSPLLLIAVGFTSLASFTIPSYQMFLTLRLLRFPIAILAGFV